MPEVILPCPACGAVENESDKFGLSYRLGVQIVCHKCGMYGQVAEDFNEAVGKWNALLRALTWGTEPPKVPGWYWWRTSKGQNVNTIQVWSRSGVLGYCFDTEFITALDRGEWAGPIPAPID